MEYLKDRDISYYRHNIQSLQASQTLSMFLIFRYLVERVPTVYLERELAQAGREWPELNELIKLKSATEEGFVNFLKVYLASKNNNEMIEKLLERFNHESNALNRTSQREAIEQSLTEWFKNKSSEPQQIFRRASELRRQGDTIFYNSMTRALGTSACPIFLSNVGTK